MGRPKESKDRKPRTNSRTAQSPWAKFLGPRELVSIGRKEFAGAIAALRVRNHWDGPFGDSEGIFACGEIEGGEVPWRKTSIEWIYNWATYGQPMLIEPSPFCVKQGGQLYRLNNKALRVLQDLAAAFYHFGLETFRALNNRKNPLGEIGNPIPANRRVVNRNAIQELIDAFEPRVLNKDRLKFYRTTLLLRDRKYKQECEKGLLPIREHVRVSFSKITHELDREGKKTNSAKTAEGKALDVARKRWSGEINASREVIITGLPPWANRPARE